MKLYIVTFKSEDTYWSEPYMADNHEHALEQCVDANPPDIEVVNNARIPFYMVERAYLLATERRVK